MVEKETSKLPKVFSLESHILTALSITNNTNDIKSCCQKLRYMHPQQCTENSIHCYNIVYSRDGQLKLTKGDQLSKPNILEARKYVKTKNPIFKF